MQSFEFSFEELDVLREVLQHAISEIDVEVFRTDTHDFKLKLKQRKDLLEGIRSKLGTVLAEAA